jgi:hypothetical protein
MYLNYFFILRRTNVRHELMHCTKGGQQHYFEALNAEKTAATRVRPPVERGGEL